MTRSRRVEKDYGKIIDYDPLWKGPLEIERQSTDVPFIIAFCVYAVIWFAVGIYAFSTGNVDINWDSVKNINNNSHKNPDNVDVSLVAYVALAFVILSVFLSLAYIVLLRYFPKVMVFTGIFVVCALLLGTIIASAYFYAKGKDKDSGSSLTALIVSSIVLIITVIVLIVFRKKVIIACGVVKEASKVVIFFPSSLLFPVLPYLLYILSVVYFGATYVYLSSIPSSREAAKKTPPHIYFLHALNVFGLLWMTNFIYAFSQMVLSGSFATWYWTMDKERVPGHTILKFMRITVRYHLGTLAFGSLIIAICEAIKMLLKAASDRSRESGNNLGALIFSCIRAVFGAVENFIEYINRNAYIMCSLHGSKFFHSAKDAFNLLMRNIMNVLVINKVTEAVLILGQLLVIGLSVLFAYLYCRTLDDNTRIAAVVVVLISSALITSSFFSVLNTAIDTIFLCVLEDYERNDGSDERPYFMSYKLRELLIQDS